MQPKLLADLFSAYYDARRNKRNTANQLKFELRMEENLLRLYRELSERTYRVGRSVAFVIEEPVKREVFAAGFADRVVHHLYFNYVNEIFERAFITDSYSCRKGKGTSYGIKRIEHHMRGCSANYTRECFVLKLDLSGYFMSIDRQILYDKIMATLRKYASRRNSEGERFGDALDYDLLEFLTRQIVFHDPASDCFIKGQLSDWDGLPDDKSMFCSAQGTGLPIGNLTSQLFSNVYLNDFDQFVKRTLRVEHYGRYVDDFYIVHPSKEFLTEKLGQIKTFLADVLRIKLHPKKIYLQSVRRGVTFLGAVIKPHRTYMARRTTSKFKKSIARGEKYYRTRVVKLYQMLNSYLGFMQHHKTYNLRRAVIDRNPWLGSFGCANSNYRKFSLFSKYHNA